MSPNPTRALCLREKLLASGAKSLSDTELLTVFISSGSGRKSCVQLAQELLGQMGNMRNLVQSELVDFQQISGLGLVKYVQLQAAREMCRRSDLIRIQKITRLTSPQQTYTFLKRQLRDRKNETFAAIFLDSQHGVIAYEELFSGTINAATIHARPLISRVLKHNAAALILAHNHPSGFCEPSPQDRDITWQLQKALACVDAHLLDHIVVGDNEVYSIMTESKKICC